MRSVFSEIPPRTSFVYPDFPDRTYSLIDTLNNNPDLQVELIDVLGDDLMWVTRERHFAIGREGHLPRTRHHSEHVYAAGLLKGHTVHLSNELKRLHLQLVLGSENAETLLESWHQLQRNLGSCLLEPRVCLRRKHI